MNHDALYNLANTYLAMKDGRKLIETSQKLLEIDPLGGSNVRLLANGYQIVADTNKQIEVVMRLLAMPVEVSIDSFFTAEGRREAHADCDGEGRRRRGRARRFRRQR